MQNWRSLLLVHLIWMPAALVEKSVGKKYLESWFVCGFHLGVWEDVQIHSTAPVKSNQITFIVTSPQHKCLGEWNSYERAPDSAEKQQTIYIWTDSAKKQQTIYLWTDSAKKQQTIYLWTDSAKKQQTIYIWTDSAKKQQTIYIWTDSAKKLHWSIYSAPDSAKKTTTIYIWTDSAKKNNSNLHMDRQCKKQQQFTYGQYIFTDCTEDNVQNTHTYTQYA